MKNNVVARFFGHFLILAVTVAVFITSRNMPLLATLGFESGSLLAALFAPLYFMAAASQANPADQINFNRTFIRTSVFLAGHLALLLLLLGYNGLFVTSCSPSAGLIPFLIAAFPPLLLNTSLGTLVATWVRRPVLGILATMIFWGAYAALIGYCWWQEPNFRILTHFSLLISSDLMEGAILPAPLYAYRLATLCFAASVLLFGNKFLSSAHTTMFREVKNKPVLSILLIVSVLSTGAFLHFTSLHALGKSHRELESTYTLRLERRNIIVRADPILTSKTEAQNILNEALYYHHKIGLEFGDLSSAPLTIWLHKDNEQKFAYTGAKNVHFALPTHRALHIANATVPHNVLGHELAHIYAGEFSQTWWGLPGKYFIVPNMALTEGVAMALTPELNLDNDLTMLEQAKALYHANVRINIQSLFSLSPTTFALSHPRSAYIYSGAFIDFLLKDLPPQERRQKLIAFMKHGSIEDAFAQPADYDSSLARFTDYLKGNISPDAILWAQKAFLPTSILGRDCTKTRLGEKEKLSIALLNNDIDAIKKALNSLPNTPEKRALAWRGIESLLMKKDFTAALSLINYAEPLFVQDRPFDANFQMAKFNSLFQLGERKSAQDVLNHLDESSLSLYEKRLALVLTAFANADALTPDKKNLYASGIAALLAPADTRRAHLVDFFYRLGHEQSSLNPALELANLIAHYISARIKMNLGLHEEALIEIQSLQNQPGKLPSRLELECQKMLAQTYMSLGENVAAYNAFLLMQTLPFSAGEIVYAKSMADRIAFALTLSK